MSTCETCWNDAYMLSRLFGGSQVGHYQALLKERADHDTDPAAEPARPTGDPQ